jgi:transcriptional regulator with XRE-family HTH domain
MSHARAGLEQALKETRLKQKDLADKLGVSTITVSRWVNGHQDPRPLQLQELCDLLNKSPAD